MLVDENVEVFVRVDDGILESFQGGSRSVSDFMQHRLNVGAKGFWTSEKAISDN